MGLARRDRRAGSGGPLRSSARRAALGILAAFVSIAGTIWAAGVVGAVAPPPAPVGNVTPALDTVPSGTVGVAASSTPVEGRVAVIVQNSSTSAVRNVRVTSVASRPDGGLAAKAVTNDLLPSALPPGAIALGLLEFRAAASLPGTSLTFTVRSRRAASDDAPTALQVGSLVLSPPLTGDDAQTLTMKLGNPGSRTIGGPLLVRVTCFGESARPTDATDTTVRRSSLKRGATVTAVVKLHDLCPSYLVAARGASVR